MNTTLEAAMQRTRRYWYEDGLSEMGVGGLFFLIGLLFLIGATARSHALFMMLPALGFPVLLIGGQFLLARLIQRAKERLTYPRTGYVAYPAPKPIQKGLSFVIAPVVSLVVVTLIWQWPQSDAWISACQGIVSGGVLVMVAASAGVNRLYLEGVVLVLCGLALSLLKVESTLATGIFFTLAGLLLLSGGGLALRVYLRTTSPAEGTGE